MPRRTQHIIHISHVQAFRACRQAWHWSSPQGLNLMPVDKYAPFFTGSLVHHCLEYRHKFATPADEAIAVYCDRELTPAQKQDPKLLEQIELVKGLLAHYALWQKHDKTPLADRAFCFVDNERPFNTKLWSNSRHTVTLAGIYDGVVQSLDDGKYYLWEIKTTRSIAERSKQLALDAQTDAYVNAAQRELNLPISGIIYTLIRKKIPEAPKELKNGLLSQAANQDTTAEYFLNYVKHYHSDRDHAWLGATYGQFLNDLLAQDNRYFARIVVNRSQAALADSWQQLEAVTREMIAPHTAIYRNETYACNYCLFREPCIAKRDGGNYQAILANNYVNNPRYADEVGE
jgi:PD-(D/E)XK nuclease superfamily